MFSGSCVHCGISTDLCLVDLVYIVVYLLICFTGSCVHCGLSTDLCLVDHVYIVVYLLICFYWILCALLLISTTSHIDHKP